MTGKHIASVGLSLAGFALAQKLGNYENKPLALVLAILFGIWIVAVVIWATRDIIAWWRKRNRVVLSLGPLVIDDARWACVNDAAAYIDKTAFLQDRVRQDSLRIRVNNDLGDPCIKFHPELGGHSKELVVHYSRKGSVTAIPNEWLEL